MADKTAKKPGFMDRIKNNIARVAKYLRDTKGELKKVVWPTREQSLRNTGIVIVVVLIAAAILIVLDMIFSGVIRLIIGA